MFRRIRGMLLLASAVLPAAAAPARAGSTERVSVSSTGEQANADSFNPALSADGRFVAFSSFADNLARGDTNGYHDVFVRDRETGTTERVSVGPHGVQADDGSGAINAFDVAISGDGRSVALDLSPPTWSEVTRTGCPTSSSTPAEPRAGVGGDGRALCGPCAQRFVVLGRHPDAPLAPGRQVLGPLPPVVPRGVAAHRSAPLRPTDPEPLTPPTGPTTPIRPPAGPAIRAGPGRQGPPDGRRRGPADDPARPGR